MDTKTDDKAPAAASPPKAPASPAPAPSTAETITFPEFIDEASLRPAMAERMALLHKLTPSSRATRDEFTRQLAATRTARI